MCNKPYRSRHSRCQRERGAVTIEFAIVLVGVVAMLAAVLLLMSAALTGLRCIDAAHTAARMSAIGEPSDAVQNVAQKLVGLQATTALNRDGKWVAVTVRSLVPNSPWRWEVSHTAVAYVEPDGVDPR